MHLYKDFYLLFKLKKKIITQKRGISTKKLLSTIKPNLKRKNNKILTTKTQQELTKTQQKPTKTQKNLIKTHKKSNKNTKKSDKNTKKSNKNKNTTTQHHLN